MTRTTTATPFPKPRNYYGPLSGVGRLTVGPGRINEGRHRAENGMFLNPLIPQGQVERSMNPSSGSENSDDFAVKDRRFWADSSDASEAVNASAEENANRTDSPGAETRTFAAETKELLQLMIHSLYSNKSVFLRELISNASDAIDRLRFEGQTNADLLDDSELCIWLAADPEQRTLTIRDNGIGMNRDEVVSNIGTIAHSGTRELLQRLKNAQRDQAMQLIGQFGVGFYSCFTVADRVTLVTRRAGEQSATEWRSSGDGTYTIRGLESAPRGTELTLQLKPPEEGEADFSQADVIRRVVKQYSDFVRVPIKLLKNSSGEGNEDNNDAQFETLNSMRAIWTRRQQEVSAAEYNEFYQQLTFDPGEPLARAVITAEGRVEYQALLYVPGRAPFDLFQQGADGGLQLYVRSVKIMDRCSELLPRYLRFVRGVVESPDLPLNVSREILQSSASLTSIRRGIVKKVLDTLKDLKNNERERYQGFFQEFGRALKEGIAAEPDQQEKLVELLLFESSDDTAKACTLEEYLGRMPDDQDEIYYITGSRASAERSPHLESFRERGYEVLYLVDPVDELVLNSLREYKGKAFKSAAKGQLTADAKEDDSARAEREKESAGLLALIKDRLQERVKDVRISTRLTKSPACLVSEEQDFSPQLEQLIRRSKGDAPPTLRILELNPEHVIFKTMQSWYDADSEDARLSDYAVLLLGQALLAEGSEVPDPADFSQLVAKLMAPQSPS